MFECKQCMYKGNHPFGITEVNGLCSGCFTHKEKDVLNWDERENLFDALCKNKRSNKDFYDCVVPVIGDAEDFYTLSIVLQKGLRPLVVSVNDYFKNDIGWHNIHQLITHFDVDSFVFNLELILFCSLVFSFSLFKDPLFAERKL
mgnify:CR=1 FL=1